MLRERAYYFPPKLGLGDAFMAKSLASAASPRPARDVTSRLDEIARSITRSSTSDECGRCWCGHNRRLEVDQLAGPNILLSATVARRRGRGSDPEPARRAGLRSRHMALPRRRASGYD